MEGPNFLENLELRAREEAEARVRSVMEPDEAERVLSVLSTEQINDAYERGEKRREAIKHVRAVMEPEEAEKVLSVLSTEQINLVRNAVEGAEAEKLAWERAEKEGRTQEMVALFNNKQKVGGVGNWWSSMWTD